MAEALPQTQESTVPKKVPTSKESDIVRVRSSFSRVLDSITIESAVSPELENRILDAFQTIQKTLRKNKPTQAEMVELQRSMKTMGTYENAVEAFGIEGLKRYFTLLSGPDIDHPYFFTIPLIDDDLEYYWIFDFHHDDPEYQDQCVLDGIDDEPMTDAVNLLVSRLKANPDFYFRVKSDAQAKEALGKPTISNFNQVIFDTYQNGETASGNEAQAESEEPKIPLKKSFYALSYYFHSKDRLKKLRLYEESIRTKKILIAAKAKKDLRKLDCRCLGTVHQFEDE